MENQHRMITGYRDLSQADVELMNEIKAEGLRIQTLHQKVCAHYGRARRAAGKIAPEPGRGESDETHRLDAAEPDRWLGIAETHLQVGLMALTRAVAQPTTF